MVEYEMMRTLIKDSINHINEEIVVQGWVHSRRDHGGLIFIDLRDHSGLLQLVVNPEKSDCFKISEGLRDEFVISVKGTVKNRDKDLINPKILSGKIELVVEEIEVLNTSESLPISLFSENESSEEQRFKYRYLDLRTNRSQEILKRRAEFYRILRNYMDSNDFTEVTTPVLANSSPEGARDFLVPSRVHPGKFYALPQSPQQFKQLLMVGGLYRYYQIATCFRDEDPRADRLYGDFYHLDIEMSFVSDGEEVRKMTEPLIKDLVLNFAKKKLLFKDIPRISYSEAMDLYGTDKPDLRFDLKLTDVSNIFASSEFSVFRTAIQEGGVVKAINLKKAASKFSRSQIDHYTELATKEGAKGLAYIIMENDELRSPILKFLSEEEINKLKKETNFENGDLIFFGADKKELVNRVLGKVRDKAGDDLGLKDPDVIAIAWIVDFPLYEWNESEQRLDFGHNPFSMPKGGLKALDNQDKLNIVADQYDMVMNGYEICSGAVRNHHPEIMYKVFESIGYQRDFVDKKFGAMVNAFKYGAPPHAGCAFGIDRIFMILLNEDNIREVVAFPKNGSGVDLMMDSPSEVDSAQLKELHLRTIF